MFGALFQNYQQSLKYTFGENFFCEVMQGDFRVKKYYQGEFVDN